MKQIDKIKIEDLTGNGIANQARLFHRDEPETGLPDNPFGIRSHRERKCLEVRLPVFRMQYRRAP